ncbi:MAG: hypothetical protein U0528_21195 [Anaerolineae bacterium]|nr:hypothetical protein [Anaerolineae bacterium]
MNFLRLLLKPRMLILYAFTLTTFLGMVAINALAPRPTTGSNVSNVDVGELVPYHAQGFGLSLLVPSNWQAPINLDADRLLISETGSTNISPTADPFLIVVTDALNVFKRQLTLRDDYSDPQQQLDALVAALNRDAPGFRPAEKYEGANYPGAITRGFERGNELMIILLDAGERGWIYIGAQTKESQFDHYEQNVFLPISNSLKLD